MNSLTTYRQWLQDQVRTCNVVYKKTAHRLKSFRFSQPFFLQSCNLIQSTVFNKPTLTISNQLLQYRPTYFPFYFELSLLFNFVLKVKQQLLTLKT